MRLAFKWRVLFGRPGRGRVEPDGAPRYHRLESVYLYVHVCMGVRVLLVECLFFVLQLPACALARSAYVRSGRVIVTGKKELHFLLKKHTHTHSRHESIDPKTWDLLIGLYECIYPGWQNFISFCNLLHLSITTAGSSLKTWHFESFVFLPH